MMFALRAHPYLARGPPLALACADPWPGSGGYASLTLLCVLLYLSSLARLSVHSRLFGLYVLLYRGSLLRLRFTSACLTFDPSARFALPSLATAA